MAQYGHSVVNRLTICVLSLWLSPRRSLAIDRASSSIEIDR